MCKYKVVTDGTKRNRRFEQLCAIGQNALKKKLVKELNQMGREVICEKGYILSKGSLPIGICAHLDTVHENLPKQIVYEKGKISSPQGIGGDDRCGVYMIMEIIKDLDLTVMFFEDEEIGGVGSDIFASSNHCKELKGKLKYVVELDRMNSNDAVYYDCENDDFCEFIEEDFWKGGWGSFTDICHICPTLECAGVNLSCGYYKQHHKEEYVVLSEMERAIKEVKRLIARSTDVETFEYVEAVKRYGYYDSLYWDWTKKTKSSYTSLREEEEEDTWQIEYIDEDGNLDLYDVFARSEAEAIGHFCIDMQTRCYEDITDIVCISSPARRSIYL